MLVLWETASGYLLSATLPRERLQAIEADRAGSARQRPLASKVWRSSKSRRLRRRADRRLSDADSRVGDPRRKTRHRNGGVSTPKKKRKTRTPKWWFLPPARKKATPKWWFSRKRKEAQLNGEASKSNRPTWFLLGSRGSFPQNREPLCTWTVLIRNQKETTWRGVPKFEKSTYEPSKRPSRSVAS